MRRKVRFAALAAAPILMGVVVTGWWTWSAAVADDVRVAWSPDSPACEGTKVRRVGSSQPVIEAKEGMRCVVAVRVTNDSGRSVHLANAVAPVVGPDTGAVVTAANAAAGPGGGVDALFALDRDLVSGETMVFEVVLVLHPEGCNDSGTLFSENWPTVAVDVLGRTVRVRGDNDFAFHREGPTPGCPGA